MVDTHRERSALVSILADNTVGGISPQDHRDQLLSSMLRNSTIYTSSTPTIDDDDVMVLLDGTSNTVTALLATPTSSYPIKFVKAINIDNAVALDPGANNLDGSTSDYVFATANDAIIVCWAGVSVGWVILSEYLNA